MKRTDNLPSIWLPTNAATRFRELAVHYGVPLCELYRPTKKQAKFLLFTLPGYEEQFLALVKTWKEENEKTT